MKNRTVIVALVAAGSLFGGIAIANAQGDPESPPTVAESASDSSATTPATLPTVGAEATPETEEPGTSSASTPVTTATPTTAAPTSTAPTTAAPATSAPTTAALTTAVASAPAAPSGAAAGVSVMSVVDGDTLEIAEGTVRILGYDTPERGECGYSEATDALRYIVNSGVVTVTTDNGDDTDRYGRVLRHVLVDGTPVGLTMISLGLANARYDSLDGYPRHRYQDQYRAADGPNRSCAAAPAPAPAPVVTQAPTSQCSPYYPDVCIPPRSQGDLDCGEISYGRFTVLQPDPHGFDRDADGIGCESN